MTLPEPLQQIDRTWVQWRGQTLAYFAGCDYFRMASHPQVLAAARDALDRYGLNVAASRRTTGNHILYEKLEETLAAFFQSESALVVSNGYLTNLIVMQAIAEDYTSILIDERSHSSLFDAAENSTLGFRTFKHRDPEDLKNSLITARVLVLTDAMFAHDGSVAPIAAYHACLPEQATLLIDDSHGAGVLPISNLPSGRAIRTLTLSKAFGAFGGAILCSSELRQRIVDNSPAFAGSTPLPLPYAAAAIASCNLLRDPSYRLSLLENCQRLKSASPILARPADQTLHRSLLANGIFPSQIRYQHSPAEGYFRFAISSEHTRAQLDALADALSIN